MRKVIGALCIALLAVPLGVARAEDSQLAVPPSVSIDEYLFNHTSVKAIADDFVLNETTADRRAGGQPAGYSGDYGHKDCKIAKNYKTGDTENFWVSGNVANTPLPAQEIEATLAAKSKHGYMWVESEYYVPIPGGPPEGGVVTHEEAQNGLMDWEGIYVKNRKYFGTEPHPNVVPKNLPPGLPKNWRDSDCDERIHILNFPIDTPGSSLGYIAGYYSSEHEYPNGNGENQSPYSNEKEMFFMNSATLDVGGEDYAGVLAHEFFHMIQFGNDYNEATWVNEGMADVAAVVNGFGSVVDGHISSYEDDPNQHLLDWKSDVADYGQAFLFFDYLFNHYGEEEDEGTNQLEAYGLAKLLTRTRADSIQGIRKVLANRPRSLKNQLDPYYDHNSFVKVFKDYLVANYLDLPDTAEGQFGYANRDVAVANAGTGDSSADDATAHQFGGTYHEVTGQGAITSTAEDPIAVIPAREGQPDPQGGYFAWSNRSDEMITWLQRRANLTDANAPTLVYRYWHQIEEDWDYAYVRVSRNGGKSWEFQNTADCGGKATDPNGNNRATSKSGGITGDSGGWQKCTLPLAEYKGDKVIVRFEYDTDQAVTEPGLVVDNVKVKDGNKSVWGPTKFETGRSARAWNFGGEGILDWLRLKPMAKNKPLYQYVEVDGNNLKRRTFTRKGFNRLNGQLEGASRGFDGADKTVFIFSGIAPIATDPFEYGYDVER